MPALNKRGFAGYGQDIMQGANALLADQSPDWPYWWEFPRSNSEIVQKMGWIPAPATPATPTEIVLLEVPAGFRFVLKGIVCRFSFNNAGPSPFYDGSGFITWAVTVNAPIGATALAGYGLPDLQAIIDQRGSHEQPWPIMGYSVFEAYDQVRVVCQTTADIAGGVPNMIGGGLFGWWEAAQK